MFKPIAPYVEVFCTVLWRRMSKFLYVFTFSNGCLYRWMNGGMEGLMDGWWYPALICFHHLIGAPYGFADFMQIPGYGLRVGCEEDCWNPLEAFFRFLLPLESFQIPTPSQPDIGGDWPPNWQHMRGRAQRCVFSTHTHTLQVCVWEMATGNMWDGSRDGVRDKDQCSVPPPAFSAPFYLG